MHIKCTHVPSQTPPRGLTLLTLLTHHLPLILEREVSATARNLVHNLWKFLESLELESSKILEGLTVRHARGVVATIHNYRGLIVHSSIVSRYQWS